MTHSLALLEEIQHPFRKVVAVNAFEKDISSKFGVYKTTSHFSLMTIH